MQAKANGKQTLWVLLMALVLIALCTGGLWAYVQSAGAETGVQETSLPKLPEENSITITWEKYDNFPLKEETRDYTYWKEGYGLILSEKVRLAPLKEAYAKGSRPLAPAPELPYETGFAIVPLDPTYFGGICEYYFLPQTALTDEQLLQLIAYGEEKGEPFIAETLTAKNSMRGYGEKNRLFSAGESERQLNLVQRIRQEGLDAPEPSLPALTLPISGIAYVPMNPNLTAGLDAFVFFPFRELTDDELLLYSSRYIYDAEYTYLNLAEETNLNPAEDIKRIRALMENLMHMPLSAKQTGINYRRKESTGEIRVAAQFESALINGKKTHYIAKIDLQSGQPVYLHQYVDDKAFPTSPNSVLIPKITEDINDSRWADVAGEAVQKLTDRTVKRVAPTNREYLEGYMCWGARFTVYLEDGSTYQVIILIPEGTVIEVYYSPNWQDAMTWYNENHW